MSNFLVDFPTKDRKEEDFDFLDVEVLRLEEDVCVMHFDGASDQKDLEWASS